VSAVPCILFTQTDKKVLVRLEGESSSPAEVFDKLHASADNFSENFRREKSKWHPKIKSILESCPVIIFIKGTPQMPKCGFTEQLLAILNEHKVEYTYYDIIADEYMRYWLRNYNGWPTYPQIYIDGKLLGGLDVLKESIKQGEFQKLLKKSMQVSTGGERFKRIIEESKAVIFVSGFEFEDSQSKNFIDQVKSKHQEEHLTIVNATLDEKLKSYLEEAGYKLPCFIIEGKKQE